MKQAIWRAIAVIEAVCLAALITVGAWWIRETRNRTRSETLRALNEYLKPPANDGILRVPNVIDVSVDQGELRLSANGQPMDLNYLAKFARTIADASAMEPTLVRPAAGVPVEKVIETLKLIMANGVKTVFVCFKNETLALTDHNVVTEVLLVE